MNVPYPERIHTASYLGVDIGNSREGCRQVLRGHAASTVHRVGLDSLATYLESTRLDALLHVHGWDRVPLDEVPPLPRNFTPSLPETPLVVGMEEMMARHVHDLGRVLYELFGTDEPIHEVIDICRTLARGERATDLDLVAKLATFLDHLGRHHGVYSRHIHEASERFSRTGSAAPS